MSEKLQDAAIRLGEALEKRGWQVFEDSKVCPKCVTRTKEAHSYCPFCGDKLLDDVEERTRVEKELRDSLVEALYP